MWTVENAAKTLVWTKNVLSVFKKQKTEVFENALVWTRPEYERWRLLSTERKKLYKNKQEHKRLINVKEGLSHPGWVFLLFHVDLGFSSHLMPSIQIPISLSLILDSLSSVNFLDSAKL